jgi:hypothetical protein
MGDERGACRTYRLSAARGSDLGVTCRNDPVSAMAALVNRTISPPCKLSNSNASRRCRKLRELPQVRFDPSIGGKAYVKLNGDRSI